MKYEDQEEIDAIATEFIKLKKRAEKTKSAKIKKKYKQFQNFCMKQFKFLVTSKVAKYKQFSNYKDLEQDGFEALLLALKTYQPAKGSFTWWADKYISTRISRAANAHSTIRVPIKKARDLKPFKTASIPVMIDQSPDGLSALEVVETVQHVTKAVKELPQDHQRLISLLYGLNGLKPHSLGSALKMMAIPRPQFVKILEEAKNQLKEKLTSISFGAEIENA